MKAQGLGRASWKVAPCRAVVRHEESVPGEEGIADQVAHAGRCVTRCVHDGGWEFTKLEGLSICEEVIKLGPILPKVGAEVENP